MMSSRSGNTSSLSTCFVTKRRLLATDILSDSLFYFEVDSGTEMCWMHLYSLASQNAVTKHINGNNKNQLNNEIKNICNLQHKQSKNTCIAHYTKP